MSNFQRLDQFVSALYGIDNESPSAATIRLPSCHVKSITSPSNPFVKHCLKLRYSSSYRHTHGSTLVVGTNPIREIYKFQRSMYKPFTSMDCLFILEKSKIPEELQELSVHLIRVSSTVMDRLSGMHSSESVEAIALIRIPNSFVNFDDDTFKVKFRDCFLSSHRILVLDGIQDPGNLGTLLRSAMAFSWDGVFLLPGCCDPFNEKAIRASRGASFQIPIISGRWNHLKVITNEVGSKTLAGYPCTNQDSKPILRLSKGLSDSLSDVPVCLVLGSEGGGIGKESMEFCELVSIPMMGASDSLNVSVAGGIFLYMLRPTFDKLI